jgi:hypothetical protein
MNFNRFAFERAAIRTSSPKQTCGFSVKDSVVGNPPYVGGVHGRGIPRNERIAQCFTGRAITIIIGYGIGIHSYDWNVVNIAFRD